MTKLKRHIARVLLGIFFIPIVFQSLHIIWHHSHFYQDNHFFCSAKTICSGLQKDTFSESRKDNHCPICTFKSPIKSLPDFSVFETAILIAAGSFTATVTEQPHQQAFSLKSPRAPPFHH